MKGGGLSRREMPLNVLPGKAGQKKRLAAAVATLEPKHPAGSANAMGAKAVKSKAKRSGY